jgi:hypothetical protein
MSFPFSDSNGNRSIDLDDSTDSVAGSSNVINSSQGYQC